MDTCIFSCISSISYTSAPMPPGPSLAGRSKANLYSWNILPGRSWRWPRIHCAAPFPYQRPDTSSNTNTTRFGIFSAMLCTSLGFYSSTTYYYVYTLHIYVYTKNIRAHAHAQNCTAPFTSTQRSNAVWPFPVAIYISIYLSIYIHRSIHLSISIYLSIYVYVDIYIYNYLFLFLFLPPSAPMPPGPFLAGRSKANLYSWNILPGCSWRLLLIHCAAPFPYQRPDTSSNTNTTRFGILSAMLCTSLGFYSSTTFYHVYTLHIYVSTKNIRAHAHAQNCTAPFTIPYEYAGERLYYGVLFLFSLNYEYSNLEHVHIHVIYRVDQAEYAIRIPMAAPQEYVNTYAPFPYQRPDTPSNH